MDEISPQKQIASIFAKVHSGRVRYSPRLGWVVRDADNIWRPDELLVTQVARLLCAEAAKYRRDRRLDSEATVETVLRLASFEPRMTAAIPEGDTLFAVSAAGRAAI